MCPCEARGEKPQRFTRHEIEENHRRLLERDEVVARFGYSPRACIDFVLRHALPLKSPVLEFATGKGRFLCRLAEHVGRVTTVELQAAEQRIAMLNAAHAGVMDRIDFVVANGLSLPWPDRCFESVVSMNTMHHVDDVGAVMRELVRVTRPGGRIVISDFDEEGYGVMERIHASEGGSHPRSAYCTADLVSILAGSGWTSEVHHGSQQVVVVARPA